jgi:site-specific DNA-methyltransferase (adenine-specific)
MNVLATTERLVPRNDILVGDAATELRRLPDASVDMVLTSPPYFRLRDYGHPAQLGLEDSIDQWVEHLEAVAREIGRLLVPTGTFWLNVADSYATHPRQGARRKSLLLGPERLALRLSREGWLVRNKIVWAKTNHLPTSARDRLACSWEALYVFVRQPAYFFDLDALRVPHTSPARKRRLTEPIGPQAWRGPKGDDATGLSKMHAEGRTGHPLGKNPGDVWRLPAGNYRGHHATFPVTLAERAIRAGCPETRCTVCRLPWRRPVSRVVVEGLGQVASRGALRARCGCDAPGEPGLVLDPFFGSGSTGVAAQQLRRDWLGIELNPMYAELAAKRLADHAANLPNDDLGAPP